VLNVKNSLKFAAFAAVLVSLGLVGNPASGQTAGVNVAVIDVPYIFKNHLRFQQQIDDIKKDIDGYKAFITEEQQKLRSEAERLEQFRPGTKEYREIEESIARMRVELQVQGAQRQKDFMEREAKAYYNLYREIEQAVADVAGRYRIGLVLRHTNEEMDPTKRESIMQGINKIVVYQSRLDITNHVLDALNRGTPPPPPGGEVSNRTTGPPIPPRR
jgi:Skp family chaperone for outer membrane proteins